MKEKYDNYLREKAEKENSIIEEDFSLDEDIKEKFDEEVFLYDQKRNALFK